MNETMIDNHNEIVGKNDTTIHAGDFSLANKKKVLSVIKRLNGHHIFLNGSHDKWLKKDITSIQIYEMKINGQMIVICHYCMRTWARSHFGSWHLYGHSHGKLPSIGKSMDIGVDIHGFYPYSYEEIVEAMDLKEDNPDLIKK